MPAGNDDLHGSAPDKSDFALLLIDVINDLDFPEANQLLRFARPMEFGGGKSRGVDAQAKIPEGGYASIVKGQIPGGAAETPLVILFPANRCADARLRGESSRACAANLRVA